MCHDKEFELHFVGPREPLMNFKQGNKMNRFYFRKVLWQHMKKQLGKGGKRGMCQLEKAITIIQGEN